MTPMIYEPRLITYVYFQDANVCLVNPPDQSLGFIFGDSGFDVWLFNGHGTSTHH